jgi:hypothetical protein
MPARIDDLDLGFGVLIEAELFHLHQAAKPLSRAVLDGAQQTAVAVEQPAGGAQTPGIVWCLPRY